MDRGKINGLRCWHLGQDGACHLMKQAIHHQAMPSHVPKGPADSTLLLLAEAVTRSQGPGDRMEQRVDPRRQGLNR